MKCCESHLMRWTCHRNGGTRIAKNVIFVQLKSFSLEMLINGDGTSYTKVTGRDNRRRLFNFFFSNQTARWTAVKVVAFRCELDVAAHHPVAGAKQTTDDVAIINFVRLFVSKLTSDASSEFHFVQRRPVASPSIGQQQRWRKNGVFT